MICVSVQEKSFEACKAVIENSPMVELRGDLCRLRTSEVEQLVALHRNMIFTCRIAGSSLDFAKEQIFTAIRRGVKYVDVEIEAPQDFMDMVSIYAKDNGTKLIISYHNYSSTPSLDELSQIAELCMRKGADIIKIVTTAENITDAVRVLSLYKLLGSRPWYSSVKLVAFAMGEAGRFSRFLSLSLGAPYSYVAYGDGNATAPGQYTVEQLKNLLAEGEYRIDYRLVHDKVSIPCSKSVAQRAVLAAILAEGESRLHNFEPCNDILGALDVAVQLGCKVEHLPHGEIIIKSPGARYIKDNIAVGELVSGESGLLTRLLIPFAAYLSDAGTGWMKITGHGSIMGRNLKSSSDALKSAGVKCRTSNDGYLPFHVQGPFTVKEITISGKESSQTVSGMLMTLPLLDHDTILKVEHPTSLPYIDMTLSTIKEFGVDVQRDVVENGALHVYRIKGGCSYRPARIYMEPDWSSASFFVVAYAIASSRAAGRGVKKSFVIERMAMDTNQADEAVLDVVKATGVGITVMESSETGLHDIEIVSPAELKPFEFDATNAPDLFPILSLYALFCTGTSKIKGVSRLFEKESNRAESIFTEYTLMGADIGITGDEMFVNKSELHSANLHSHNDHRMAMSLITASLFIKENSRMRLDDIKCIDKSFPSFITKL